MCRACEWAKCQLYNLSSWLLLVIQNSLCNWSGVTLIQNPNREVILKVTLCFTSPISSFNGIRKVSKEIWWSLGMKSWNSAFKCTRFESNYSRSYTLPTPAVLWVFWGYGLLKAFFLRVWSLDTSFEDVCVVQNSGCKFCVRKETTNQNGGGFLFRNSENSVFEEAWFFY